jgi:anti-sigma B factor antagonist
VKRARRGAGAPADQKGEGDIVAAFMRIVERRVGDVTILKLAGRLELDDGDTVLRDSVNQLAAEGRVLLLLDVADVTRMDSAGIGMLVGKYMTVKKRGGTIKLLHLTERTSRLMDITRLVTVFEIFHDEDEAVRSFAATVPPPT